MICLNALLYSLLINATISLPFWNFLSTYTSSWPIFVKYLRQSLWMHSLHLLTRIRFSSFFLDIKFQCTEGSKSNIPCCARQVRATFAWYADGHTSYANFARNICVTYAPDSLRMRVTSANPTQMLRAPAARGARNTCYFWTPVYS
jgi:hypothetical protein